MDSTVEPESLGILNPPWGQLGRAVTLGLVSGFSKLVLNVLNTTTITNHDTLLKAMTDRGPVGLLTVCNHTSMFDDPGVLSALIPWHLFWTEPLHGRVRWTLCAKEVCFKNEFLSQFFLSGKTLPVERGKGVHQPIVSVASAALARGDWLHLFPEGRINFDGGLGPLRWGVGKMVCEARALNGGKDPLIIPFYHSGMGYVLPWQAKGFGVGHQVSVVVGEPVDLGAVTCRCCAGGEDQGVVWRDITLALREALLRLEARAPPNRNQSGAEADTHKPQLSDMSQGAPV